MCKIKPAWNTFGCTYTASLSRLIKDSPCRVNISADDFLCFLPFRFRADAQQWLLSTAAVLMQAWINCIVLKPGPLKSLFDKGKQNAHNVTPRKTIIVCSKEAQINCLPVTDMMADQLVQTDAHNAPSINMFCPHAVSKTKSLFFSTPPKSTRLGHNYLTVCW